MNSLTLKKSIAVLIIARIQRRQEHLILVYTLVSFWFLMIDLIYFLKFINYFFSINWVDNLFLSHPIAGVLYF